VEAVDAVHYLRRHLGPSMHAWRRDCRQLQGSGAGEVKVNEEARGASIRMNLFFFRVIRLNLFPNALLLRQQQRVQAST
jgi:hypothetical protein